LITKHFVTIGDRQVHYRRAGSGPAVILLHQSPVSSLEMEPLMRELADRYTAIAVDTPGYGLSDPLPMDRPEMDDYADALAVFLDALEIQCAPLYGTHTGAMIAAAFAARYPERTRLAVIDGYVVLNETERADILAHYFAPFWPKADGSHLAWLWARMRDQVIFFPWYRKERSARMKFDVPPPEFLMPYVMDFLRAGDAGRKGYEAAFRIRGELTAQTITAPTWLMAYETDGIFHHLDRLTNLGPGVHVERYKTPADLHHRFTELLAAHSGATPPPAPPTGRKRIGLTADYIRTESGPWFIRRGGRGEGPPIVLLHDAGQSSAVLIDYAAALGATRPVLLVDLPGHGETGAGGDPADIDGMATTLAHALAGQGAVDIVAWGTGGVVAVALARLFPQQIRRLALIEPPPVSAPERAARTERFLPDLTPDFSGSHLQKAWYFVRDQEIFSDWYAADLAHGLNWEMALDPADVHRRVVEVLKAGPAFRAMLEASSSYAFEAALNACEASVLCLADPSHPDQAARAEAAAGAARFGRFTLVSRQPVATASQILSFLA
jgi:pimeloyl-ACP methyl ester carboxylesterase